MPALGKLEQTEAQAEALKGGIRPGLLTSRQGRSTKSLDLDA